MTVNPGFGGQPFIYEVLQKFSKRPPCGAKRNSKYHIGVDGGIDFKTAGECAQAGADAFISGTTLFSRPSLKLAVKKMRKIVDAS